MGEYMCVCVLNLVFGMIGVTNLQCVCTDKKYVHEVSEVYAIFCACEATAACILGVWSIHRDLGRANSRHEEFLSFGTCIYVGVYILVFACVCIYVFNIHKHTHTHTHTHIHTHIQTHTHTRTHTYTHTHAHMPYIYTYKGSHEPDGAMCSMFDSCFKSVETVVFHLARHATSPFGCAGSR